ncbi:unnamed protein product [Closterium sp. NIES-65]|nr:unnamed protein product [Closterium sp. NIES-65]
MRRGERDWAQPRSFPPLDSFCLLPHPVTSHTHPALFPLPFSPPLVSPPSLATDDEEDEFPFVPTLNHSFVLLGTPCLVPTSPPQPSSSHHFLSSPNPFSSSPPGDEENEFGLNQRAGAADVALAIITQAHASWQLLTEDSPPCLSPWSPINLVLSALRVLRGSWRKYTDHTVPRFSGTLDIDDAADVDLRSSSGGEGRGGGSAGDVKLAGASIPRRITLSWLVPAFLAASLLTAFLLLLLIVSLSASAKANLQANSVNNVFFCAFHVSQLPFLPVSCPSCQSAALLASQLPFLPVSCPSCQSAALLASQLPFLPAMSTFSNTGAALLNDNLMGFVRVPALIIVTSVFILIGNTMYPPTLRALLLLLRHFSRGEKRFVYSYLLVHPRKCYTHLFPPRSTVMLVLTVLAFNLTEFVFFCATDWTSPAIDGFTSGTKVLAGYFQSVSTRNAGFNVIAIGLLRPPMLLLYLGMMYVAVYPLYLTRQTSREQREVYDDEDIGVFWEDLQGGVLDHGVFTQGRGLLLRDSAMLFMALLVICLIESANITNDISNFNIFNIAFELISGYGNVGLSLGYTCPPEAGPSCVSPPYSFSGVWSPWSKLVLVLVMLLGRHRGLPDNIDAAISLPNRNQFIPEPPALPAPPSASAVSAVPVVAPCMRSTCAPSRPSPSRPSPSRPSPSRPSPSRPSPSRPSLVAPPLVSPPLVAPPLVAPPLVAPPLVAPPLVAPPLVAPPLVAPPLVAPPLVAPPLVAPPLVAPPLVAPPLVAPPLVRPSPSRPSPSRPSPSRPSPSLPSPSRPSPSRPSPSRPSPSRPSLSRPSPSLPSPSRPSPSRPSPSRPSPSRPSPSRPSPSRPSPSRPSPSRPSPSRPSPSRPSPSRPSLVPSPSRPSPSRPSLVAPPSRPSPSHSSPSRPSPGRSPPPPLLTSASPPFPPPLPRSTNHSTFHICCICSATTCYQPTKRCLASGGGERT